MQALAKTRPTLEAAAPFLDLPVLPVSAAAVCKLTEAVTKTSAWIARVSTARTAPFQLSDAQTLLEEGLALPLHTAEVTHLQDAVAAATACRERLTAALDAGGRLEEHEARAAYTAITATHLTFPEAQRLGEALHVLGAWQVRVRAADGTHAPLTELKALEAEAAMLPVACSEVANLSGKLAAAEKWVAQARDAMERRAPLKEMRRLLHAGERQPVDIPEVAELKVYIRRREWEEAASRALQSKTTITAALQLIAEAPAMGVNDDSPAVVRLSEAIAAVQQWDASAAAIQDRCAAAAAAAAATSSSSAALSAPSEEEVAQCLQAAATLRLRSERHAALSARAARAARWRVSAQAQLDRGSGGATAAAAPLAALEAAAAEGAALGLREPLLAMLADRIAAVQRAGVAVAALLEKPLGAADLPRLEEALSSAAAAGVSSTTAAALTERRDALRWEADACAALDPGILSSTDNSAGRPSLLELLNLLRRAAALPVDTELQERVVETALHGFAWEVQACDVLGSKLCASAFSNLVLIAGSTPFGMDICSNLDR
jgi:hypothetical protein